MRITLRCRAWQRMPVLSSLLLTALAVSQPAAAASWQQQLSWQGQTASMTVATGGDFVLHTPTGDRRISAQSASVHTASLLFDGLFAMAQDDLRQDSVTAISDDAFDHGQSMPCACFETGVKWHYVWTRDLSYSVDLGLWRFDPARAKASLLFKLSDVRGASVPAAPDSIDKQYPMQDTGSGGSWPVSTDRIVWFLGARHLLDDRAFADQVYRALTVTLVQDRQYAFDDALGLYRGETSFLDWREQTYPAWTANNVVFIAQSFALSTNVLHYQALQLAVQMAELRNDPKAADYRAQSDALKAAINAHFWRADRSMYMSYVGGDGAPMEAYDLLGLSLAITSGVADAERARQSLANYPTYAAGSPVIWPERADQPIYHNRAIWPFVSAYALRAARTVNDPERIAHELRSLMRGAALSGSNMENFELTTQSVHVDDGKLSGPVVDSPRQLWSVAGYLGMVTEGIFGLTDDGRIEPKLPVSLVPMLFGNSDRISLQLPDRRITLLRPAILDGNLLVTGTVQRHGTDSVVELKSVQIPVTPLRLDAPMFAPPALDTPTVVRDGKHWLVSIKGSGLLYRNGQPQGAIDGSKQFDAQSAQQCFSVTQRSRDGLESLPSPAACVGDSVRVSGAWPRDWVAPASGKFQTTLTYSNDHGPINTGVTAAVKLLVVRCGDNAPQSMPVVMPHSDGTQHSTTVSFTAQAHARCSFSVEQGFNMSYLRHFSHYTGGSGGVDGPLNTASIGDLQITPLATGTPTP
ncbi:MAG: Six-hairpin glycosidase-like protein [Rhodanobacter sp.]